ncbi:HPF/RaiA family ribosome-associated protein [Caenimonas terrae]|uniref:HPF/RaiA family ribosome-associated protein n=1 Tax=Caenimonas terrae TaxID=696074 RepID=A0ABW0NCJ4_9BURK
MKLPLQITFRNIDHSDAIEAKVRERAEKLDRFHRYIMSCRVTVEESHKHHHQGNHYHIRADIKVPDRELVASREPDEHHAYEDVYVAIRDVFDSLRRQLEDYARLQQRKVKTHDGPAHGRVVEIHPQRDFGWIETGDGRLVYFHRNSLVESDISTLAIGANVRFDEEMGEEGPQATTVHLH